MMFKSSLATLALLLGNEALAVAVPVTAPAAGGASQPIRFHNCNIDNDGLGVGKEATLRGLFQSAINTAGTAHRGILSMAPTPGEIEVPEKIRKAYENWFLPAHLTRVRDMFHNYAAVLTSTDMTLHVYCHPYTYRKVRVPHADDDVAVMAWNRADTGEDDPNAAEVSAPTPKESKDDPDGADEAAKEVAENLKEMKDRHGAVCGTSYAYVPGGTNRLYLCPKFWELPDAALPTVPEQITDTCTTTFGTNGKINKERILDNRYKTFTLIHELSHTVKVAQGTGVMDSDEIEYNVPGTTDSIYSGGREHSGYTFARCRSQVIKNQAYRNADSYSFAAFDIWKQINCSGTGKRRRGRDTQVNCEESAAKRPSRGGTTVTKIRRGVSPEQLDSVCALDCEKGYKEMVKPVFPMSGKGVSKKVPVCVPIAAVPCKKGQGIKFVEHRDTSSEGWPLIKEVCDANTKPDNDKDKEKDPQKAEAEKKLQELEAKKKELEDKKAAVAAKQEQVKETVRQKTKDKAPLPLPTDKSEGKDKKCPKGLAGLACRAANAAT